MAMVTMNDDEERRMTNDKRRTTFSDNDYDMKYHTAYLYTLLVLRVVHERTYR